MSETPDIRIVVGADLVKTKSVVGEDLQYISKQINAGKPIANVAIGLDVNGTRKLFEEKLKLITKDIKVDGIKLDLSKAIENKPLDLKINSKNISDQVSNSISNATKNMKITLPKVDSSKLTNEVKKIALSNEKYSNYYVGKISNKKSGDSDDRVVSLQLYNDELKKAISLKYQYDSKENAVKFISQDDITNTKQLLDLQERLLKSQEKIKSQQYKKFSDYDTKIKQLDSSYLSGSKKIVDENKLIELKNARQELINTINISKDNAVDGIVSDKDIVDIGKMIDEYKLLINVKKEAEFAPTKLAADIFTDGKNKTIMKTESTINNYKRLGDITKDNQIEVNKLKQAIVNAEDSVSLKRATTEFDTFIVKIKSAKNEMKTFTNVSDLKDTGKMYVSSRSKTDAVKNIQNQFLAKDAGAKVSIKGTDYIDGNIKAYKELSATVTYSTGEVKKFNFEQAKIGKDIGYIESSSHTIKSVVDGNLKRLDRQKEAVRSMYDELSETNGNDKQVQSLFTKHQGLGVDRLQYTEKIKELQNVYLTVQKAFASKPSNVSENDWFDQNYEKIEGLKVGLKDLLPLFDVAKKELSTSLAITDTSRIGDTKAIKAKNEILDLIHTTEKYRQTNDRLDSNIGLSSGFDNFIAKLRELSNAENISEKEAKELNQEFKRLKNTTQEMGLEGQTFGTRVASQMQKFGVYLTGAGIMYGVWNQIKKMTTSVVELDTAMTELKKVTDETDNTYSKFLDNAEKRAKKLGATLIDTVTATADASRMGFDLPESEKLADTFTIYKNVGDGIKDMEQSSSSTISAMKAFGIEAKDSMSIIDSYNEVSNTFSVRSDEIGLAVNDMGAAFAGAGNNLHETVGVYTGMNEIIQDWSKSSTAMRTISARLRNTSGELDKMGIDSDGAAESVTKLQQQLKKITGVDIMSSATTFKSTTQQLRELSGVWDELNDKEKADVSRLVAGTRQQSTLQAVMTNWDQVEKAITTSMDSAGKQNCQYVQKCA